MMKTMTAKIVNYKLNKDTIVQSRIVAIHMVYKRAFEIKSPACEGSQRCVHSFAQTFDREHYVNMISNTTNPFIADILKTIEIPGEGEGGKKKERKK